MSNLVKHAERELALVGEDETSAKAIVAMVKIFAKMGHSGGSAPFCIAIVEHLLRFQNLTPLTNDPSEWQFHGPDVWGAPGGVWQNKRNPEAFSTTAGQTYYLVSEKCNRKWWQRRKMYTSKLAIPWSGSVPFETKGGENDERDDSGDRRGPDGAADSAG